MFDFIKRLFRRSRRQVSVQQIPYEQQDESRDIPPRFIPIETLYEGSEIPGTKEWIGEMAKVIQTMQGEQITWDKKKGVRLDCGHLVFAIDERITNTGIRIGLGGVCSDCESERKAGLYCSQCGSHCDGCGRNNICTRHTRLFKDIDDQEQLLCPDCFKKADMEHFFKKTLLLILWPFLDHNQGSESQNRRNYYDY
ncbi:hypothetical protein ACFL5F_08040 [Planctomycetota bacterium]